MPICKPPGLRLLSDEEFKQVMYGVMQQVFKLHSTIGSLFDESIYKRVLVKQIAGARAEEPIVLSFGGFQKILRIDLLVSDGALLEFKAAEAIHDKHRSQLLNYLYLLDLPHGKLVNLRPDTVQHEFANAPIPRAQRVSFQVIDADYLRSHGHCLRDVLTELLRDWGTCLDVSLYEEAVLHVFGLCGAAIKPIEIRIGDAIVGSQKLCLLSDGVCFHITAFGSGLRAYASQLKRFLAHAEVGTIQWVNVGRKEVTFSTISK